MNLPAPVFHPLFMTHMYNLLRGGCLFCHRFKLSEVQLVLFEHRLRLLDYGLVQESDSLAIESPRGAANAAMLLADDANSASVSSGAKKSSRGKKADEEKVLMPEDADGEYDPALSNADGEAVEVESPRQFRRRIEKTVQKMIFDASHAKHGTAAADQTKDQGNAAYSARKRLVNDFIKANAARKRCDHCHA